MSEKENKNVNEDEIEVLEIWEPKADEIIDAKDRHIKMSKQSTNRIVITLVALAAFLIMWYSTFAQPLAFNARTAETGSWDIRFTDMYVDKVVGFAKELTKPSYTAQTATFSVSLTAPGDSITYDLTITNNGNLDVKVESIYIIPEDKNDDTILYSVDKIHVGDELDAGESTHMTVSATYNKTTAQEKVSSSVTVLINYEQN